MSRPAANRGFTAEEIAIPGENAEAIALRLENYEAELRPNSTLARDLVGRVALMMVRLDRSARREASAVGYRMRNAGTEFDEARRAEADHLITWIAGEPVSNARRLRNTAEGLDLLIAGLEDLKSDLTRQPTYRWEYRHCDQLHSLLGLRRETVPISRARALTEAIAGKFEYLEPDDCPGLETMEKRKWAIARMFDLIEAEIATLKNLLASFDREAIQRDRAEAADRAIFDDSTTAVLARKHEAATERGLYRALREFREIQAETLARPQVEPKLGSFLPEFPTAEAPSAETLAGTQVVPKLGSFFPEPPTAGDVSTEIHTKDPGPSTRAVGRLPGSVDERSDRPGDGFDFTSRALGGPDRETCRAVGGG